MNAKKVVFIQREQANNLTANELLNLQLNEERKKKTDHS